MSATGQSTAPQECARWMPRKQTYCARGAGHPPPCATPEAMERQRQRAAERRPTRVVASEAKARWNKTHKFVRFGITEERFEEMLEAQGHACAICREPFRDQRICLDHDSRPVPHPTRMRPGARGHRPTRQDRRPDGGQARPRGCAQSSPAAAVLRHWKPWLATFPGQVISTSVALMMSIRLASPSASFRA
jgi:hypothetical protein